MNTKKIKLRVLLMTAMLFIASFVSGKTTVISSTSHKNLYDFKVKSIDGNDYDLAQLKGKKVLIVNVASRCGLTPQYKNLEVLYQKYKDHNFVIIAFPANNFNNQEPGSNVEIEEFCSLNYAVTFPIMSKISVKGNDIAPIYSWLTSKSENGVLDSEIAWNFQKYLINENGEIVKTLTPTTDPLDKAITKWIEE